MVRLPLTIMGVLLVLLVAGSVAFGGGGDDNAGTSTKRGSGDPADVATIARRVEQVRGLRYDTIPRATRVTGEQAKREATADAARPAAARALRAESALDTLFGLVPPRTDFAQVSAGLFDGAVAGYYDPRDGRLRVIQSVLTSNRVLGETTLAHELTHALDDQAFDLDTGDLDNGGDRALAYTAMVEGSATAAMTDYQRRFVSAADTVGSLGAALGGSTGTEGLPPFVTAQLLFPYLGGSQWIGALRRKGGWPLVDVAFRDRPPVSTEQVIHPGKWLAAEGPDPVRLPRLAPLAGASARRIARGSLGEWQTRQLLATGGGGDSQAAAAGWGGDRYELWRANGAAPCATPCVGRDTLLVRWRWDTREDAREFLAGLRTAIPGLLDARRTGRDRWTARGGAVAVAGGAAPALVLAPTAAAAQRVLRAP